MNNVKKFWVGGALNMAAGAYGAIAGGIQERNARKKMAMAAEEAASPIRSQAARQRVARQEGDAQASIDSALRAEATAAQQLAQSGGSRALAGRTASLQRAAGMSTDRALQQFGDYDAQLSAAQDASQVNQINQRLGGNLTRLQRAADAGRAQTYGGIAQGLGGLAQVAGSLSKKKTTSDNGGDIEVETANGGDIEVETADPITGLQSKGFANLTGDIGSEGGVPQPAVVMQALPMRTDPNNLPINLPSKEQSTFVDQYNQIISNEPTRFGSTAGTYNTVGKKPYAPDPRRTPELPMNSFERAARMANMVQPGRTPEVEFGSLRDEPFVPQMLEEEEFIFDRGGMQPTSSDKEVDALKAMLNMVSTIKKDVSPSDLEEEVRETPGEFDHDDNPIDIVQGEEKIGEMTGGEYIFNPEQAEMLKQLSNEGDSELHEFIRNLLSKEQFNG
tara:strand:- start:238 stop:1578 length:1341 start_codon:yes stop_codon:yes gene_type:complete